MRTIITIFSFVVGIGFASVGQAESRPAGAKLLSYQQLMMLPSAQRQQYLRDLAKLLVLMEKMQVKYEVAGLTREELKEYVAWLEGQLALLPQAEADEESEIAGIIPQFPQWRKPTCSSGRARFDEALGTCVLTDQTGENCPAGSQTGQVGGGNVCIPNASWQRLSDEKRASLTPKPSGGGAGGAVAAVGTPVVADNGSGGQGAPRSSIKGVLGAGIGMAKRAGEAVDAAAARARGSAMCSPEPAQCENLSADARAKKIGEFQKVGGHLPCIRGGFFSNYENNVYKQKRCVKNSSPKLREYRVRCKANEELCNPALFCVAYSASTKNGSAVYVPSPICARLDQTFTANCESEFNALFGKSVQSENTANKDKTYEACDPAKFGQVKVPPKYVQAFEGFKEEYSVLVEQTKKMFDTLCAPAGAFKDVFCTECGVIRQHYARMHCQLPNTPQPGADSGADSGTAAGGAPESRR